VHRGGDAPPDRRGWGGVSRLEQGPLRAIEHTAARKGRHDLPGLTRCEERQLRAEAGKAAKVGLVLQLWQACITSPEHRGKPSMSSSIPNRRVLHQSVTAGVNGSLPAPWGWRPMAPFFWDRDRGKTRVVTVCGRGGMSEPAAAGR